MKRHRSKHLAVLFLLCTAVSSGQQASPYAGQESRAIKALSAEDVEAFLEGKGMGLAKAAELNGYPGPAHVLEVADTLGLTSEQRSGTEALFAHMQTSAVDLGRQLVENEQILDSLFAARSVTHESLRVLLARIGALQGQLRHAHLVAHLEQAALLSPDQVAEYNRLRGYGGRKRNEHQKGDHH